MATVTTLQVGTYSSQTDSFTLTLDLNDRVSFFVQDVQFPQAEKAWVESFNIRTPGVAEPRFQYKNFPVTARLFVTGASVAAITATLHSMFGATENPPYILRVQLAGSSTFFHYAVRKVTTQVPYDAKRLLSGIMVPIDFTFECAGTGCFTIPRQWCQNLAPNPGFEAPSGPAVGAFLDTFATTNAYTVFQGSAPSVSSNVMTIPSGTELVFGSPSWGPIALWQIRWQWITSLTAEFLPHVTDSNNYTYVSATNGTFALHQVIAGTDHQLTSSSPALTNGNFYWVTISQFPAALNDTPFFTVSLYNDSAGSIGTLISNINAVTFDAVTALIGRPHLKALGAALAVGGVGVNNAVHYLALFGPGGWTFGGDFGTGFCSGGWDQNTANTFPNGATKSYGAARIDIAPAGTVNACWFTGDSTSGPGGIQRTAIPVIVAGNVLGFSAQVKSTGLGANCSQGFQVNEYDSNGNFLRQNGILGAVLGNQTSWTQITAQYTTGANCTYVLVQCIVADTNAGASANGTVWFDNFQVWNQTQTGMTSMPYHELIFTQSPAQFLVTGLLGDLPAPCLVSMGTFESGGWPNANIPSPLGTVTFYLGKRAQPTANAILVANLGADIGFLGAGSPLADATAYGGFYQNSTASGQAGGCPPITTFAQKLADLTGTYHTLFRGYVDVTSGSIANVVAYQFIYQLDGAGGGTLANNLLTWSLPTAFLSNPFAINGNTTWTAIDVGQLQLPPSPFGPQVDQTRLYLELNTILSQLAGATWGGSPNKLNWSALIPTDGGKLTGQLINFNGPTLTGSTPWLFAYADASGMPGGATPGWSLSNEFIAIPAPSHGMGGTGPVGANAAAGQAQGFVTNPTGDYYMTLDPKQSIGANVGVNQFAGLMTDQAGSVLAMRLEFQYSPCYQFPK